MDFVLASASPQRSMLLRLAGVPFEAVPTDSEETGEGRPEDVVLENARRKAYAGRELRPEADLVLGADTEVSIDGRVLGKASSPEEARAHLDTLSGRTHEVLGAIVLLGAGEPEPRTLLERTAVTFARLEPGMVDRYLASGEWRDRAGSYAVQGLGAAFVAAVDGDLANVVGLPLTALARLAPELFST